MLCPEVWNFKAPESTSSIHDFVVQPPLKTINDFTYTHLVTVVLPDISRVPQELTEALTNDCDYYKVSNLALKELVEKKFLDSFVKSGKLYLLSNKTRLDCDNCVAVTPKGQLILNLDKVTYQSVGLEGVVSHFHTRTRERFLVTIDLKAACFKPGKPNYERVRTCLGSLLERFEVILAWNPDEETICPSSVAKYFRDLEYEVKLCQPRYSVTTLYTTRVPYAPASNDEDTVGDMVEWLGAISLGCEGVDVPEPNREVGRVQVLRWQGFFTAQQIEDLLALVKKHRNFEWNAIYAQGFSDSPVTWQSTEHHYYTNGDTGYILFLLNNEAGFTVSHRVSQKRYKNKYC